MPHERAVPQAIREAALALLRAGHSLATTATTLGVSPDAVYDWRQRWRTDGTVAPRPPRGGRPPRIRGDLAAAVASYVDAHPEMTVAQVRDWLATTHDLAVSCSTMRRTMLRLGFRFH